MTDELIGVGSPVKDFIKNFMGQVKDGLEEQGLRLCKKEEASIILELNAVEVKEKEGGVNVIRILNAGAKKEDTNSQKITVYAKKEFNWKPETQGGRQL